MKVDSYERLDVEKFIKGELPAGVYIIGSREASKLLQVNQNNRVLSQWWVSCLEEEFRYRKWFVTTQAIGIDTDGNLCDGQHRLHGLIAAGVDAPFLCVYGLDPEAFAVMDQGKRRSAADALSIQNPSIKNRNLVASVLRLEHAFLSEESVEGHRAPTADILDLLALVGDGFIRCLNEVAGVRSHLRGWVSPSVLAWVYVHAFGDDAGSAGEWMEGIAKGEGLKRGDPRLAARRRLISGFQNQRLRSKDNSMMSLWVLHCSWEKFLHGMMNVKVLMVPDKKTMSDYWPSLADLDGLDRSQLPWAVQDRD